MSDDIKVALIVSVPPTILALSTLIVGVRNSRKLDIVHKQTNSNLSKAVRKITKLEKVISDDKM
jgi:hypothetical protein